MRRSERANGVLDREHSVTTVEPAPAPPRVRRARRRWILFLAVPVLVLLAVAGTGVVVLARVQSALDAKIQRFGDPFAAIPAADRPAPAGAKAGAQAGAQAGAAAQSGSAGQTVTSGSNGGAVARPAAAAVAMNLLVFGSDSRISAGDPSQWQAGAQRTDSIMFVHIPADRSKVFAVSIPRDSWVPIPGHGTAKINAAFSFGGPALAIRTVEQLTGVRIDHMLLTDFTGFARITDLLGGVDVTVPETTHGDTHGEGQNFTAGTHHMDGATALSYVRQRYVLPGGDFDRVKRQQNWIRATLRTAAASGAVTDPVKLYDLLDAVAGAISTDSGFTIDAMRDLALSLRHVGPGGVVFLTVPTQGTGWSPDHTQSIVLLDQATASGLWSAARADAVDGWLASSGYQTLGTTVR